MNKAKVFSKQKGKLFLREKFIDVETIFINELKNMQRAITHAGTLGDATEDAWISLLRKYLPTRYRVAKAFAVDYLGNTTDQLDCLIYDAFFTPALFGKDKSLYVPAEAVYATFEIKQIINTEYLKAAAKKVASIRALKRTSAPLNSPLGVNQPKSPFHIVGGLLGMNASWRDGIGKTFLKQFNQLSGDEKLDLILTTESGFCDHLTSSNPPTIVTGQGSLIRGLFRLLKTLRKKASVTAVEWEKYEAVFDD